MRWANGSSTTGRMVAPSHASSTSRMICTSNEVYLSEHKREWDRQVLEEEADRLSRPGVVGAGD